MVTFNINNENNMGILLNYLGLLPKDKLEFVVINDHVVWDDDGFSDQFKMAFLRLVTLDPRFRLEDDDVAFVEMLVGNEYEFFKLTNGLYCDEVFKTDDLRCRELEIKFHNYTFKPALDLSNLTADDVRYVIGNFINMLKFFKFETLYTEKLKDKAIIHVRYSAITERDRADEAIDAMVTMIETQTKIEGRIYNEPGYIVRSFRSDMMKTLVDDADFDSLFNPLLRDNRCYQDQIFSFRYPTEELDENDTLHHRPHVNVKFDTLLKLDDILSTNLLSGQVSSVYLEGKYAMELDFWVTKDTVEPIAKLMASKPRVEVFYANL